MAKVMEVYRPEAIVFQSGADSLGGDMLGVFNLTIEGHAKCLMFMESFNIPLLVLGGGGYTINNVARCWAYETGRILGTELSDQVPDGEFKAYFAPDYRLHVPPTKQDNQNSQAKLEEIRNILLQNLSKLRHAPSVGFHIRIPDTIRHDGFESNRPGMSRLGMLSSLLR